MNFDIFHDVNNNVYQVRTKSEAYIFEFPDIEEESIFLRIVDMYTKNNFYTYSSLVDGLKEHNRDKVYDVIQELLSCKLLNASNYEQVDVKGETLHKRYKLWNGLTSITGVCKLGFIGHSQLCDTFFEKAKNMGYLDLEYIKVPEQNATEEYVLDFIDRNDFIVMDATYWNPRLLSDFNRLMLLRGKPWLYVDGMIDSIHYSIGPIFHGEETGCYECLESRIRSNDYNLTYSLSYKKFLEENNKFSKNLVVSKPIEEIIANFIILEVNKYNLGIGIPETWKNTLLFNINSYSISKHYFLKNPLCSACHPQLSYTTSPWLENIIDEKLVLLR